MLPDQYGKRILLDCSGLYEKSCQYKLCQLHGRSNLPNRSGLYEKSSQYEHHELYWKREVLDCSGLCGNWRQQNFNKLYGKRILHNLSDLHWSMQTTHLPWARNQRESLQECAFAMAPAPVAPSQLDSWCLEACNVHNANKEKHTCLRQTSGWNISSRNCHSWNRSVCLDEAAFTTRVRKDVEPAEIIDFGALKHRPMDLWQLGSRCLKTCSVHAAAPFFRSKRWIECTKRWLECTKRWI